MLPSQSIVTELPYRQGVRPNSGGVTVQGFAVETLFWIIGGWTACGITLVTIYRLLDEDRFKPIGPGLVATVRSFQSPTEGYVKLSERWGGEFWETTIFHAIVFLISPFVLVYFAGIIVFNIVVRPVEVYRGLTRRAEQRPESPAQRPESPAQLLEMLIRRRRKLDKRRTIREPPEPWGGWYWYTSEAVIYDTVRMCCVLRADGVDDPHVWRRLEIYRSEFGTGDSPPSPTLTQYVEHRLRIEVPAYPALEGELIEAQVRDCEAFILDQMAQKAQKPEYPPVSWLGDRMPLAEFNNLENAVGSTTYRYPTDRLFSQSDHHRKLMVMRARMQPGDEVRWFHTPPDDGMRVNGGIALVRDGQSIEHITVYRAHRARSSG